MHIVSILSGAQNEMDTAVSLNDIAHLSDTKPKRSIFEWPLHLTTPKRAEISTRARRRAVPEK